MEKRICERIPAIVEVRFFCGNSLYSGTVTNLSEKGMCINTRMCLPFGSRVELLIPLKEEVLNVPVKVSRVGKTDTFYDTMGVEILNPPKNYLEFAHSFRPACKS